MATYTDNYQLTKPTYAEQADIGVINSNMNKIDDVMHSSQISLAPAYDSTQTYAEGDVVMYELLMYKCISPTTGVWDASKWERTTASESGGGGSAELDILGEASGAVASFTDGASAGLAKCIAEIVPKQDLHGYDKPWAGGTGKNKLPLIDATIKSLNTYGTWSGDVFSHQSTNMTFEIIKDSANNITGIKCNGTNSGGTFTFGLSSYNFGANTFNSYAITSPDYIASSGLDNDSATTQGIQYQGDITQTYIRVASGYTFPTDTIVTPMIRPSIEPSGFEPYSNICLISGHSSVTVTVSDGETITTKTTALGQTVYGGTLNVLTGELVVDRTFKTFNGSETWYQRDTNTFYTAWTNDSLTPTANGIVDGVKNNIYEPILGNPASIVNYNGKSIFNSNSISNNNASLIIRDERFNDITNFKTELNNNNIEVVYPLSTPQTVQLTPQEVNSLLGQNNISADTGDIDIVYVKASAPIQPNPTGEPTATLKKLGINGTIYGITGSGGGGGDGDTNVYGAFIDTNRVIYDSFVFDETEHTWTATSDCILAGYIDAPSTSRSCYVDINSVAAFIDYESHNGVFIPVKEGQIVTYLAKSGSVMKAYGLTFGTQNIFTPQIYSTEEREVGVWIDNKPLYQKTYNISQTILEKTGTVIPSISVSGMNLINGLAVEHTNSQATPVAVYTENNTLKVAPPIRFLVDSVTIWYTKTTDTAGSGSYNTLGVPMVHYSTDEQVIGTFEDENGIIKPLYQKMVRFTNISKNGDIPFGVVGGENYMLITGKLSSSFSFPYIHGSAPSNNIGGFFDGDKWSLRSGADAPSTVTGFMIIQYTKITD